MECKNYSDNAKKCNCTYPCERKGYCCECIAYHKRYGELPACYFSTEAEKSYDRSIDKFLSSKKY